MVANRPPDNLVPVTVLLSPEIYGLMREVTARVVDSMTLQAAEDMMKVSTARGWTAEMLAIGSTITQMVGVCFPQGVPPSDADGRSGG